MKKSIAMLVMVGLVCSVSMPAFAIKQLSDQFKEVYGPENKEVPAAFQQLVKDAACNVCHIKEKDKKKERNAYGSALHKALEEAKFPVTDFQKDAKNEKYIAQLKEIFKKVGEQKAGGTDKTFAERIKAGELPGGDKEGKGLPEAK